MPLKPLRRWRRLFIAWAMGAPMVVEKLLTYDEVAEVLRVTTRTVYAFVQRGELIGLKVGQGSRVDPSDLRAFIEGAKLPFGRPENKEAKDSGHTLLRRK